MIVNLTTVLFSIFYRCSFRQSAQPSCVCLVISVSLPTQVAVSESSLTSRGYTCLLSVVMNTAGPANPIPTNMTTDDKRQSQSQQRPLFGGLKLGASILTGARDVDSIFFEDLCLLGRVLLLLLLTGEE